MMMPAECCGSAATAGQIPNLQGAVAAPCCKQAAVGAEGHTLDPVGVPRQAQNLAAAVGIPDLHDTVVTPRRDPGPVGTEGHAAESGRRRAEGEDLAALRHVPDLHFPHLTDL